MLEERALGGATGTAVLRRGGNELAVRAAPQRVIFLFGRSGARVAVRTFRFVLTVLDFANPAFDLLLAVDLVDLLVSWLRRDEIENQREWVRISEFLFGSTQSVRSAYGITYQTSIRDTIDSEVERQLANDSYDRNFLAWLTKWNTDRTWRGFVYSQVDIDMQRQEENNDERYGVKYYRDGPLTVSFVDNLMFNARTETPGAMAGPQDPRNRSTGGGPARYDPEHNISVQISSLKVRFTHPAPTLTPFDFMIVKCRHLLAEITTFVAAYDDSIVAGMEFRDEVPGSLDKKKINWLDGHQFPAPLNGPQVQFCLSSIFWVIDNLSLHAYQKNDFDRKRNDPFNVGFWRRHKILYELSRARPEYKGKRPMYEVALRLGSLATPTKSTPGIPDDLGYLRELATSIDGDLVRVYEACSKLPTSLEYNYEGIPPK
jgi:hypothetical protein